MRFHLLALAFLATHVVESFTPLLRSPGPLRSTTSWTKQPSLMMALQNPSIDDANSHHVKAAAAAIALATLIWSSNPVPVHEAALFPPTPYTAKERIAPTPPSTTLMISKLEITPSPGFGFGGLGVSPFGLGPFGGFGAGFTIRNVPDRPPTLAQEEIQVRKQQLKAIEQQKQQLEQRLGQLERKQQQMEQKNG